jgi:hypothetical protein
MFLYMRLKVVVVIARNRACYSAMAITRWSSTIHKYICVIVKFILYTHYNLYSVDNGLWCILILMCYNDVEERKKIEQMLCGWCPCFLISYFVFNFIVGKAFAIATAVVFGGAALVIGTVASKLELHNVSDLSYMLTYNSIFLCSFSLFVCNFSKEIKIS